MYWPLIQLHIEPVRNGLLISQQIDGINYKYVARRWTFNGRLGALVHDFVEISTRHGLKFALQHNHPGEDKRKLDTGVEYLSFASSYNGQWVCAIDETTRGPTGLVAIWKAHEAALIANGIEYSIEPGRGRNLRISMASLDSALQAILLNPSLNLPGDTNEQSNLWTIDELSASVDAYLDMLRKQRNQEKFVKSHYYADLAKRFGRSEKSFEFRMQNISYVFSLMGREWVTGLKPAKNVGTKNAAIIEDLIAKSENQHFGPVVEFEAQVQEELKKTGTTPPKGSEAPSKTNTTTTQFVRDPKVKAWILKESKNRCECCGSDAPFLSNGGMPYLEIHHLRRLADNGSDTVSNAIAVCPNCHRELHFGESSKTLVQSLYLKIKRLIQE